MKKQRRSVKTIALLAVAALLFAGGGYTATRAALEIYSPEHFLDFDTANQAVAVLENGTAVSGDNSMLTELSGVITPGKTYDEVIAARNNSDVNQFVRIVVRKYWRDADGYKVTDIEEQDGKYPELDNIKLEFVEDGKWQENKEETTAERVVYYYKEAVPSGGVTDPLTSTLTVDGNIVKDVTISEPDADGVITYTYKYDGCQVCIEAEAQSIQTHNADKAVKSIWGVTNVTATETSLTVK